MLRFTYKLSIFLSLFLTSYVCFSQEKCKSRLFLSSKEVTQATKDTVFMKSFRRYPTYSNLIVTLHNSSTKQYASQDVWGYQEHHFMRGCEIYRNYNFEFYQVRQIGSLIIYSNVKYTYYGGSYRGEGNHVHYTVYYFSKTLDSPIYELRGENIKASFKENSCFLEKLNKELKWNEDCTTYDKRNNSYKIIELYDACK